ncbi:helix-turn-helix domain-containing protein [Nocardioides sp.]|uniref:arsenate reductase/protein-tyrosine-phosphatase family protein n=1 Tax=Nocardioides sp. TaxID=35761 RepID=UPI003D0CB425
MTERSRSGEVDPRVRILAAIADPVRLRVLDALVLGDVSPGEIVAQLGLTSNLLAHHLGVLEREGLVTRHRSQADRRRSYLHLVPGALDGLLPGQPSSLTGTSRVVFVCTANSARSQLAAALWSRTSALPVTSAGTKPAASVAPGALAVAQRHDLPMAQTAPRSLGDLDARDYVVTVCDHAYEELSRNGGLGPLERRQHWSVPDPVRDGSAQAFEDVYADLEGRVSTLAHHLIPELDRAPA